MVDPFAKAELLSPAQKMWSAVVFGGVAVALGFLAVLGWYNWPAQPPFTVGRTDTSVPRPGVWRIETESVYTARCDPVVVSRRFVGDGIEWTQLPLSATVTDYDADGEPIGPETPVAGLRYAMPGAMATRRTVFEYEMTRPVASGAYVIEAEAYNCDNGWSGRLPPRIVPFSWSGE